jgi:hypothetical protein
MTINVADNNPRINYTATSGQTVFTVPFEFFASTDLTVYVDGSVLSASDYTVTGGSGSTGSITTNSGQTVGAEIAIVRDVPLERTTDLTSTYSASSLNDQLDRLVTQVADLDDRVSRSISLNDYEVGVSLDLPAKASRLGKTVQFNSTTGALEIGPSGNELTSIASIASEITALDGIKTNITTVAGAISNVNSVGSNISSVTSVAGSISNVNTVNTNIANVNLVGASISDVNDVADSIDQVEVVAASIDNVDAVALLSSNIGVVISVYDEIQTVASDFTKINTVAGITGAISTVNSNATNINLAATNIDDINDVANVITKVTSVADNIANVNAVAPSVSYLSTVANNISSVNTVATNIGSISAVNTNISDVTTISASITNVNTVADNISLINDFSQKYRIGSSDPLANNDEGDLFYNTTSNALKVYTGSAWEQGVTAGSGFLPLSGGGLSGNLSFVNNAKAIFGSGSDLQIYHDGQNSYISDQGAGQLTILASNFEVKNPDGSQSMFFGAQGNVASLYYAGSAKLLTESSGVNILGTLKSDGLWVEGDSRIGAHNGTNYDLFYDTSDSQLEFADNAKAVFGNGSDLQIYHDPANGSYVSDQGVGSLNLLGSTYVRIKDATDSSTAAEFNPTGASAFYYSNAQKLATTSTGVDVTGTLTSDGLTVDNVDINGTTVAWQNSGTNQTYFTTTGSSEQALILRLDNQDLSATGYFEVQDGSAGRKLLTVEDGGDISFYEDTGSTPKFFWDASAESLGIGGASDVWDTFNAVQANNISLAGYSTTQGGVIQNAYYAGGWKYSSTNPASMYYQDSGTHQFHTAASGTAGTALTWSQRMTIDSSGRVGIGTSSPEGDGLHVQGSDNNNDDDLISLGFTFDANSKVLGTIGVHNSASNTGGLKFSTKNAGTLEERMRITSSGNVGIGTDSPSDKLTVAGNIVTGVDNTIIAPYASLLGFVKKSGTAGSIAYASGQSLIFSQSSASALSDVSSETYTERMRIDSSGNLLVGQPTYSVNNGGIRLRQDGEANFSRSDQPTIFLNRVGLDGEIARFTKNGAPVGVIGTAGGRVYFADDATNGITFSNSSAIMWPSNSSGGVVDNTMDIGDDDFRFKDLYLSGGVYLGGTDAANKLDDVEEGTFIPHLYVGSTKQILSRENGYYSKVGNLVNVSIGIIVSGAISGSGNVELRNFPYNSKGGGAGGGVNARSAGSIGFTDGSFMPAGFLMGASTSTGLFYRNSVAGTTGTSMGSALQGSDLPSSWNIHLSITYNVT